MNQKHMVSFEVLKNSTLSSKKIDFELGKYLLLKNLNISCKEKKLFFIKHSTNNGKESVFGLLI
jgi:hypothetical protein